MVLMKQDNPIAVIFIVEAWPGAAYEIYVYEKIFKNSKNANCPGARLELFEIIWGSPGARLSQNFEISPLGHLPEPQIHPKNSKNPL